MGLILRYMQKLDQFGQSIMLNYKGLPFYQTKIGGFFTLLLIGLFGAAIYFFSKEIFERKNPITIFTSYFTEKPQPFNVTWESFPFAVSLEDGNTSIHYLNENIFKVSMVNQIRRKVLNSTTKQLQVIIEEFPIPIGPCSLNDLSGNPNTINYFSTQNYDRMYCIKHHLLQQPVFLEGTFANEVYKTITIRFTPCQNTSDSQTCLPMEEINKKLNAGYFQIIFADTLVDLQDKDNVFKFNGRDSFTFVSNLNYKNIQFYLKHIQIKTDKGWIFEDTIEDTGIAFGNINELQDPRPKQNFVQVQLRLFTQKDNYKRQYKKVQDVLAQIGGLLNALLIILGFLLIPISKLKFYKSLINQLFVFQSDQDQKCIYIDNNNIQNNQGQSGELKLLQPNKKKSLIQGNDQYQQPQQASNSIKQLSQSKIKKFLIRGQTFLIDSYKSIKKKNIDNGKARNISLNLIVQQKTNQQNNNDTFLQVKQGGFQLQWHEYIMFYLCPCGRIKKKKKQLYNSISKIEQRLDPIYILNKLNELDKLKILILNPNQLRLFQYLPKPVINFDETLIKQEKDNQVHEYWSLLSENESHHQKAFKAFMAYKQIKEGKLKSLDQKLIDLVEPSVKTVFDQARLKILQEQKEALINNDQVQQQNLNLKDELYTLTNQQKSCQQSALEENLQISLSNITPDSPKTQELQLQNKNVNAIDVNLNKIYFYKQSI